MPRFSRMIEMLSSGSIARIRTPAPIPGISLETFNIYELTVGEINIGVPMFEKQRTTTLCYPPIGMSGGVTDDIRLGLDYSAADNAFE